MKYRRVGTELIYNVTNESLIPLYEGSEAYEKIEDQPKEEKEEKPAKKASKK